MDEKKSTSFPEGWEPHDQEYFSDVFWIHINPWSCALTFGLRQASATERDKPMLRVRMPLQQAKLLAVMLLQQMRRYEQETEVDIDLPRNLLESMGIPLEDWERFKGI